MGWVAALDDGRRLPEGLGCRQVGTEPLHRLAGRFEPDRVLAGGGGNDVELRARHRPSTSSTRSASAPVAGPASPSTERSWRALMPSVRCDVAQASSTARCSNRSASRVRLSRHASHPGPRWRPVRACAGREACELCVAARARQITPPRGDKQQRRERPPPAGRPVVAHEVLGRPGEPQVSRGEPALLEGDDASQQRRDRQPHPDTGVEEEREQLARQLLRLVEAAEVDQRVGAPQTRVHLRLGRTHPFGPEPLVHRVDERSARARWPPGIGPSKAYKTSATSAADTHLVAGSSEPNSDSRSGDARSARPQDTSR